MELLEQLELVDVVYKDDQVSLIFLHADRGEIREVKWNKGVFDNSVNKYVYNEEKAAKCEAWAQEYFGLSFDNLAQAIGEKRDVYAYDTYSSLYKSQELAKFDKDMVGQIMQVEVKEVEDDGNSILIKFDYEGEVYFSRMRYAPYIEAIKQYVVDPVKKRKQISKFEEKFGIAFEDKDQLVGQTVMIEVKIAFGREVFVEVKPFPKKKTKQ